jgi:hypothetical protein
MDGKWMDPDFITFYQAYDETLEGIHRYWLSVGWIHPNFFPPIPDFTVSQHSSDVNSG